ncbi:MAG: 2,3-bisphosphoglycerate-independent phosphoglycerate mutase [Candidatus Dormibacteria bacterium]
MSRRPVVLAICDGWGQSDDPFGNAIAAAATPQLDRLLARWPSTVVAASGEAVGLPDGQQGNSEVGHLTIGAGRVIFQDLTRINRAIADGSFADNPVLRNAVDRARDGGHVLHLVGLVSTGGVHSDQRHALAVARLARARGLDRVAVHVITDGRDTPPTSAAGFVADFVAGLAEVGVGRIATVCGRYYAMDRDRHWERLERAWRLIAGAAEPEHSAADPLDHIEAGYSAGITDEFVEPCAIVGPAIPRARIEDGDVVVIFNFRPDRARELTHALVDDRFAGFERPDRPRGLDVVTFAEYEQGLPVEVAFPKQNVTDTLCEVVSRSGLRQFHVAETEKYAHVTYFINGGREQPYDAEERLLVDSPRVATYDQEPGMSAEPITTAVLDHVAAGDEALIVLNFANPDMVGHTGDFDATVRAVEVVDGCLGRIADAVVERGGVLLITADHGNAEMKIDRRDNSVLTAHTTNPVPVILCGSDATRLRRGGGLSDVAPTVLEVLGLAIPEAMTGVSLAES